MMISAVVILLGGLVLTLGLALAASKSMTNPPMEE